MKTDMPRFVIPLSEPGEPGALVRIALAKIGTWWKGKQQIRITREMLGQVVANFRKRGNGEVPIDYEHGIEYAAGSGAAVPAAGWIKAMEDAPDEHGILWVMAEWTEKAAAYIRNREYKYFSPVLNPAARDNKTGEQQGWTLTSAALTNIPVLQDLPAIALSEAGWKEIDRDGGDEQEKTTVITKLIMADRAAGMVRALMEDGKEFTLAVEGLSPEPKVMRLAEVKRGADGRFDFASLAELPGGTLIASEVIHAMNVQAEVDAAVKEGKITPAQRPAIEKLALSDLPAFREFVTAQKPQVDLSERGIGGGGAEGGELKRVDAQIEQLARERAKADTKLSYGQAMKLVLGEHPDLAKQRAALMRDEK